MAHYLTNNEKFHIFSKSPVLSSMAVSQAVNKSGHTVSTNDVWADDVPWFTEVADEAGAITRAADARYNDLILWGSDIYVRKGDKTNGASTGTTFAELWEKHTELTEARAYALGSVTTQTPTNIVTKTVEIKNASDKVVLKYHVGKQIDLLTTANNANVASTWAARMFIDGKVVDQFVSPTDKVFAGNPSTGYTTLVYTATAAGNKYGFVAEGEADADFVNNAFAGIVQFNQSRNSGHKFAASVFEYVGDKLDTTLGNIREEIQDIVGVTMEGVVASVGTDDAAQKAGISIIDTNDSGAGSKTSPQIAFTEGSITDTETKLVSGKTVKTYVDAVSTEQKIWNLNQFFNENCTRNDIHWIKEVLEYKSSSGEQLVYFQQANTYASQLDTSNKDTGSDAVQRHKDVANAWINYIKQKGHAPFELVFKKDSYRINEIIRHMFAQLDKDAGFTYLSDGSISERCMKPGLSVKYVTVLNTGESYDPFGSHIDLDLSVVDDASADSQKFYPSFTITTWHGKTRFNSSDSILDRNEPESIKTAGANSFLNSTYDSFMRAYNWTYTVNEQEHKFIVDAIKSGGSISQSIQQKITEAITADITGDNLSVTGSGITVTLGGKVGTPTLTGSVAIATYTASTSEKAGEWKDSGNVTTGAEVAKAISDAKADIAKQIPHTWITDAAKEAGLKLETKNNGHYLDIATSAFVEATSDKESEWKYTSHLATGASVQKAIGEVKAKINALHETPQFSVVVVAGVADGADWKTAVDGGIKKNTIYLVEDKDAQDGSYIEYIAYENGEQIVTERIGTTKTDLADYAKDADVVKSIATANGVSGSVENNVATIKVQDGTTEQKGIVKLTDTVDWENSTEAVTGKAVYNAIASAAPEIYNEIKYGYKTIATGTAGHIGSFTGIELVGGDSYIMLASGFITAGRYNNNRWEQPIHNGIETIYNCYYTTANDRGMIDTTKIIDGSHMFRTTDVLSDTNLSSMTSFTSPLPILSNGECMFFYSNLSTFDTVLPSIEYGKQMFAGSNNLKSFKSDLSTLTNGRSMFANCGSLEHFMGDLSSLKSAEYMFNGCKLDEESLMYIADSINTPEIDDIISIGIKNNINTLTANEIEYLNEIHNKKWDLTVNGSDYSPIEPTGIMTLDENGEEKFTPIPFWAKAVPCEEKDARYIDNEGNFFTIFGGQLILVKDPETYGMFTCEADAAANMRLTKYVRPVVEETEEVTETGKPVEEVTETTEVI